MRMLWLATALVGAFVSPALAQNDIKVLATNKTSTLDKEMNEAVHSPAQGDYVRLSVRIAAFLAGGCLSVS